MPEKPFVYAFVRESIAFIVLDRKDRLNALSSDMLLTFFDIFKLFDEDPQITYIVIKSAGEDFCAGGDIKDVYHNYREKKFFNIESFFKVEYALINKISSSKKAISLAGGIVYGAGLAIALACKYSFFLEDARASTPEINIAFYPDAGLGYFLDKGDLRFPGFSLYFGLTGSQMHAWDLEAAGLISGVIGSQNAQKIEEKLILSQPQNREQLMKILKPYLNLTILQNVQNLNLAVTPYKDLRFQDINAGELQTSPLSLWTTYTHLTQIRGKTLRDILSLDLRLSRLFLGTHDFFEGIRVKLIDPKDTPVFTDDVGEAMRKKILNIYKNQV
jgi:enoyl-CoA hydratase